MHSADAHGSAETLVARVRGRPEVAPTGSGGGQLEHPPRVLGGQDAHRKAVFGILESLPAACARTERL